jgi:SAM-dependent methyltransferase
MSERVDLYDSTYGNFNERVLAEIRRETFGDDIGQNSWITTEELETFYRWLDVAPKARVLEVASGSGGPALYLARTRQCHITGVDINEEGVGAARRAALAAGVGNANFQIADMDEELPFETGSFDGVICIDAINHFRRRDFVLSQWHQVLRAGRRVLFTDPVVITGPVTNEELAARTNIGFFVFVPPDVTERCIRDAGFTLLRREDATGNIELTSRRWHAARQRRRDDLLQIEGEERFEGLQRFLATVHELSRERKLSRFVFVAEKQRD